MSDLISRQDAIAMIEAKEANEYGNYLEYNVAFNDGLRSAVFAIEELPSAESEWNNHTVACLLADMFDDPCACNYNDIDEWLPGKCEVIDSCPDPVGVACWEQFLKHRKENQ